MPEPLKRTNSSGELYVRRTEVENLLIELERISTPERIQQFSISQRTNDSYIPSEILLYFLRKASRDKENKPKEYEDLFNLLVKRVKISLQSRVSEALVGGTTLIREEVMSKFIELLANDYTNSSTKLDYYEVNFDSALAALRISAIRKEESSKIQILPLEVSEKNELSPEIEQAAVNFYENTQYQLDNPAFRLALYSAIDKLPSDQKQVISLMLDGFPIDSKDQQTMTIAKALDCDERTVRNRRDRAVKNLRDQLQKEWT